MTLGDLAVLADDRTLILGGAAALTILVAAAWLLRRKARPRLARRVTTAAVVLGLAWSAQGMWETATHRYHLPNVVAWTIFAVFEAMQVSRMLKAHEYRADFARRARHVQGVWVIACVSALVVSLGEHAAQAPARLSIPLLVAYGWYLDLTSDDDPGERPQTTARWTLRRFALWIGAVEPTSRDARTINRDRLRDQLTSLAFRDHHGHPFVNGALRRKVRVQRLLTRADDDDITEVRRRLARSRVDLLLPARQAEPAPAKTADDATGLPAGMHMRDGKTLRGAELRADAMLLMQRWIAGGGKPTTQQLRDAYTPPLGQRTADTLAAAGRKAATQLNGNVPTITIP